MRDPLEWRSGDGPLEDWLAGIETELIGPQPDGYTLWDARTEEHVYGVPSGRLSLTEVAGRLAGLGADALHVRTSRGFAHGEPRLEIVPSAAPGRPFEFVQPNRALSGRVPLHGRVDTPTELAAWLAAWSPLLPAGVPEAGWSTRAYDQPMAVAFQHRSHSTQLLLSTLSEAEKRGGNAHCRLLLESARAELGRHLLLLRTPRVLAELRPADRRELRAWLDRLAEVWGAVPLPPTGGDPLPGISVSMPRIVHGAPELLVGRPGLPLLVVTGPAADLGDWAALLFEPAVLGAVRADSRRRTAAWLDQVESAVWGRPAAWTVTGGPGPLTTAELAGWIAGQGGRGDLHLTRVGPAGATVGGLETADGRHEITGR